MNMENFVYKIDESSGVKRISKTKVLSLMIFSLEYLYGMFFSLTSIEYHNNLLAIFIYPLVWGLILAAIVYGIGTLIGRLINKDKLRVAYQNQQGYNQPNNQINNGYNNIQNNNFNNYQNYAVEFKKAIENNQSDVASNILLKWDKNDANWKYASIIFEGMPPSNKTILELNDWLLIADGMKANDESLRGWYRSTALEVINMNH